MRACIKRRTSKAKFAPGSYRWTPTKKSKRGGKVRHLVACPRDKWDEGAERCKVSMEPYETVIFTKAKRCPRGYRVKSS